MLSVIVAYVLAMAVVGGAELARYMLPVVPSGDPDLRFDAVAQGAPVARRGGHRRAGCSWPDGSSIRRTGLRRKITWRTAITFSCTSMRKSSWKRVIPWHES